MRYLFIGIFSLLLSSCEKTNQEKLFTSAPQETKKITEEPSPEDQNCKVLIKDHDLLLLCNGQETIYKNLIINKMSVSTEFIQTNSESFSLLYDMNASATKTKEKYDFIYSKEGICLIDKEILKFGREGLFANRIYIDDYNMSKKTYDDLQNIGADLPDNYNETASTFLYNSKKELFAIQNFGTSNEDFFVEYPKTEKSGSKIQINNVETANNQAFELEQKGVNKDSKILLEAIINQYPARIVAYLNLADVNWKLKDQKNAQKNYNKYLSLMKSEKKDLTKIPKRVYDRIKNE